MTKPTTHVLKIIDRSGSMAPLADDVRGGFNTYVDSLRDDDAVKYRLTVAMFHHQYRPVCTAAKLRDVPKLDNRNYVPGGATALLDAVGKTITDFEARVPELGDEDRVLLVVQTDGQENSSTEFSRETICALIEQREKTGKWSCIYLGAGPDAWGQAARLGFTHSVNTAKTAKGTHGSYTGLSFATRAYSRGATADETRDTIADIAGADA